MSKNKLTWNIVMFLMVIALLPAAYAQTSNGFNWIFVLINALIVGIVLFLLQSFLIQGKNPQEKTAVYVIIVIASLVIAFLYGSSALIWYGPLGVLFNVYVLVNTFIIAAALYFLLGLMKFEFLKSPEGNRGFTLILILVSLVFAVKMGNQWIWDQRTVTQFVGYLFGKDGILNPDPPAYRLWTFLSSAFLLAFFFQQYLLKEAAGSKWINYGLAVIIASSIATSGYSLKSVVILGEIVFLIVLAEALGRSRGAQGTNRWNWIMSFLLVGWASAAGTYGTEYQGALATLVGWILVKLGLLAAPTAAAAPSGWIWWILIGIGVLFLGGLLTGGAVIAGKWGILAGIGFLILMAFLFPGIGLIFVIIGSLILFWVMKRGEAGKEILGAFKNRNFTRLRNELKTRFQRHATQIGVVTKWDLPEGREPKSFVENRLLLFALLDYCLRLDIFNSKRYIMDYKKKAKINELWMALDRHWNRKILRQEIANYRSATGFTAFTPYGWALFDRMLLENMERIVRLMYDAIGRVNNVDPNLNHELTNIAQRLENINNELRTIAESAETAYGNFDSRFEPYGIWHHIRSIILNAYDMYNVYGKFEHDYIFPTEGAKFRANPYLAPDPTNITVINALPDANPLIDPLHEHSASDIELNTFGFELERINNNQPPLRLLNTKKNSHFHPNLPYLMSLYSTEWKGMVEDFRKGTYAPNTRTVQDYSDAFSQSMDVHMDDDSVIFKKQGGIAFDRRALVNPGLWVYWGRRHYYGDLNDIVMESPYPRLTALGIQTYLELLIRTRERDPEKVINDFLNSYPLDLEKEIETDKDIVRAIGRWREKKAS